MSRPDRGPAHARSSAELHAAAELSLIAEWRWLANSLWPPRVPSVCGFLVVAYAITQVARWAAEDANGRLEMTLAQHVARWRVVCERGLALTVATALLAGLGSIVVAVGAPRPLTSPLLAITY